MPFFSGLASGFNQELSKDRQLSAQKEEDMANRENAALVHLSSADDPEIASAAIAGLMNQTGGKRGKGLRGFFNEVQGNPALPQIRNLLTQGRQAPNQGAQPMAPPNPAPPESLAAAPPPGSPGSAAMPAGSPTEPGSTPMQPGTPGAPPGPVAFSEAAATGTHTVPRQPFLTPVERAGATEAATIGGKIGGTASALQKVFPNDPGVVRTGTLGVAGIHPSMTGQFMGNQQLADGSWVRQERFYNTDTAAYEVRQVPIATPTALQSKPTYKVLAGPDGRPRLTKIMGDGTQTDMGPTPVRDGFTTYTDPDTQQQYTVPVPAVYEKPRGGPAASAVQPPPGMAPTAAGVRGAGGNPSAISAAVSAPPAAVGPHAAAAPAAASAASAAPAAGPQGPGTAGGPPRAGATATTAPRGGVAKGRVKGLTPTEGAILGPNGEPQLVTAQYDKGTAKYYDSRDPTKELTGFIPGKEGAEVVKTIANSMTVESTIDRAMAALKAEGLDQNDDPAAVAKLALQYKSGRAGEDPIAPAFNALMDFAKIQGASQYVQGTRAFRYIQQIQQHLPLMPNTRSALASTLTRGVVGPGTVQAVAGEEPGHQWDSGKLMYAKLVQAKENLAKIREELQIATGKTPEHAIGAGAPPGSVQVTDPKGGVHTFRDQAAADAFKQAAGIR